METIKTVAREPKIKRFHEEILKVTCPPPPPMLNGRYDTINRVEITIQPMMDLLGTPAEDTAIVLPGPGIAQVVENNGGR